MSTCFKTNDEPPEYVQIEGPWVVKVTPDNIDECTPINETVEQLRYRACAAQDMAYDGEKCVPAPKPILQTWWFWTLVFAIIAAFWYLRSTNSSKQSIVNYPFE